MRLLLFLFGPTFMILIGLTFFENVPLTFILFYGWLLLIPMLNGKKKSGSLLKNMPNKKQAVIAGLFSGFVSCAAILGVVTLFIHYIIDLSSLQKLLDEWGFTGNQLIWLILILIIINPILEELYWRDFMYKILLGRFSVVTSILITSSLYSLYHFLSVIPMFTWPLNILLVLPVFFAGVLWGYFRYKFKSIMAPVISHILADLGIMLVYLIHIATF